VNFTNGVVQTGSSGSGIFSAGGQLRGVLSSGPKVDEPEEYCSLPGLPVNYSRFSVIYSGLQDFFEDRVNSRPATPPPPPVSTGTPVALTSGTARNFTVEPVARPMLLNGSSGYAVRVPEGATRLEIQLITETPGADLDLYVRFGADVVQSGSEAVADYHSDGLTGAETITITPASTPALRAGTYYIALGVFTTSVRISGRVLATISTSSPTDNTATSLTSGVAREFSIGPVTGPALIREPVYRIVVPEGATQLEIEVKTATRGADVDLYVAYNTPVIQQGSRPVADHTSESDSGDERIVITRTSSPPLRAGTYYLAFGLFTPGTAVSGSVRATVQTTAPAPSGLLTSGQAQSFRFDAVDGPTLFYGAYSFTIDVPANARRLVVQLNTTTADTDLDLYVRQGSDNDVRDGRVVTEHRSEGPTGSETLTITPSSTPALRAGRYYISLLVYTAGKASAGTVTATIETAAAESRESSGIVLTSGQPARFSLPPESEPFLHNGNRSFRIEVPEGATSLTVELKSTVPSVDVDLFVRHGRDISLDNEGVHADFWSESEAGNETIVVASDSNPALKAGTYYISLAVHTTDVAAAGMLTAYVERGLAPSAAVAAQPVSFGVPVRFDLPAVDGHTLFNNGIFYFDIPGSGGKLDVQMRTESAGADVDLYLRYGVEPEIVNGRIIADHRGIGETGDETIAVDQSALPPLRPGRYYMAFAQYKENIAATGQVIVRYQDAAGVPVEATLSHIVPGPNRWLGDGIRIPRSAKYDVISPLKKPYVRAAE
jgi:hypothetical protein